MGATFLYVTHDQVEAMSMGTHIVLLQEGKIAQQEMCIRDRDYREPDFQQRRHDAV